MWDLFKLDFLIISLLISLLKNKTLIFVLFLNTELVYYLAQGLCTKVNVHTTPLIKTGTSTSHHLPIILLLDPGFECLKHSSLIFFNKNTHRQPCQSNSGDAKRNWRNGLASALFWICYQRRFPWTVTTWKSTALRASTRRQPWISVATTDLATGALKKHLL